MLVAITRDVSPNIGACELTHLEREAIDVARARAQHREYERCLSALGCTIRRLPAEASLSDSVFVEDTAIVLEEVAVVMRPGVETRRAETGPVADVLGEYRPLRRVDSPGTIDGGDVLRVGKTLYVGLSSRTNAAGGDQLRSFVSVYGYEVRAVAVAGCLHLKSAVTQVGAGTLLINRAWVDAGAFAGLGLVDVAPGEPMGANALRVGETVIYPRAYPETRRRLEARGIAVEGVDVSELRKAEGGVTCCSLILDVIHRRGGCGPPGRRG
jgi:dimethylargininase